MSASSSAHVDGPRREGCLQYCWCWVSHVHACLVCLSVNTELVKAQLNHGARLLAAKLGVNEACRDVIQQRFASSTTMPDA
eukprot:6190588-Pleurochrysis_carterae.AAC.3